MGQLHALFKLPSPIKTFHLQLTFYRSILPSRLLQGFLPQDLIDLIKVLGKVIYQVIPHLGLVLVLLLAVPRPVRDGQLSAALEHECHCALGDLHLRRGLR